MRDCEAITSGWWLDQSSDPLLSWTSPLHAHTDLHFHAQKKMLDHTDTVYCSYIHSGKALKDLITLIILCCICIYQENYCNDNDVYIKGENIMLQINLVCYLSMVISALCSGVINIICEEHQCRVTICQIENVIVNKAFSCLKHLYSVSPV